MFASVLFEEQSQAKLNWPSISKYSLEEQSLFSKKGMKKLQDYNIMLRVWLLSKTTLSWAKASSRVDEKLNNIKYGCS